MTGPAADAQRDTLDGGDAVSRAVQASDGVELHYLRWCSGRPPSWAVVVFLHGIASHGGWFAETAVDLDTQGVAVYAPDRRGSGRRGDPRPCPGCCCSAPACCPGSISHQSGGLESSSGIWSPRWLVCPFR